MDTCRRSLHHRYAVVLGLILVDARLPARRSRGRRGADDRRHPAGGDADRRRRHGRRPPLGRADDGGRLRACWWPRRPAPSSAPRSSAATPARLISLLLVGLAPPVIVLGLRQHFREQGGITLQTMFGVLCIYLLIGMLFGTLYGAIDAVTAQQFFDGGGARNISDFLYFSFSTLTTTGFGDLVAATDVGRSLAITEALIGQIYLVTVVALIVSQIGTVRARQARRLAPHLPGACRVLTREYRVAIRSPSPREGSEPMRIMSAIKRSLHQPLRSRPPRSARWRPPPSPRPPASRARTGSTSRARATSGTRSPSPTTSRWTSTPSPTRPGRPRGTLCTQVNPTTVTCPGAGIAIGPGRRQRRQRHDRPGPGRLARDHRGRPRRRQRRRPRHRCGRGR